MMNPIEYAQVTRCRTEYMGRSGLETNRQRILSSGKMACNNAFTRVIVTMLAAHSGWKISFTPDYPSCDHEMDAYNMGLDLVVDGLRGWEHCALLRVLAQSGRERTAQVGSISAVNAG